MQDFSYISDVECKMAQPLCKGLLQFLKESSTYLAGESEILLLDVSNREMKT